MVGQNVSFCTKFATIVFDWVAGKQYNGVVFGIFEIRNAWLWDYPSPPKKKNVYCRTNKHRKIAQAQTLAFFCCATTNCRKKVNTCTRNCDKYFKNCVKS